MFVKADSFSSTFDLIDQSVGVVCINGTAGVEAISRGKRVMLFAPTWYDNQDGVTLVKTQDDITSSINNMLHGSHVEPPRACYSHINSQMLFKFDKFVVCNFENDLIPTVVSKFGAALEIFNDLFN